MNRDTLHKMFAKVQLTKLQPKLNEHLGRRNKIGSMHVLMEEVRKVFKAEVEQFKKDSRRRTHKLREKVQDFQTLLMIETKMRPVVASLVLQRSCQMTAKRRFHSRSGMWRRLWAGVVTGTASRRGALQGR